MVARAFVGVGLSLVCKISCTERISCRGFFLSEFNRLLVDFCLCKRKLLLDVSQGGFCPFWSEMGHSSVDMYMSVCVSVCAAVFLCVCAHVCMLQLWLSDFGDYGIRPQMSRTDPKSNTQRRSITSDTHTIPSRTRSVSPVLHRNSLSVILPFIRMYYKTRRLSNPTPKAASASENINFPAVTSDDLHPLLLWHKPPFMLSIDLKSSI